MDDFTLQQVEESLMALYPSTYDGYNRTEDEFGVVEITFLGVTEQQSSDVVTAIEAQLDELKLEAAKAELRDLIKLKGDEKAIAVDAEILFKEAQAPLELFADEQNRYQVAGRPASPSASQYRIAAAINPHRPTESLRDTIEWLRTKWAVVYVDVAALYGERFGFIKDVNEATTIPELDIVAEAVDSW